MIKKIVTNSKMFTFTFFTFLLNSYFAFTAYALTILFYKVYGANINMDGVNFSITLNTPALIFNATVLSFIIIINLVVINVFKKIFHNTFSVHSLEKKERFVRMAQNTMLVYIAEGVAILLLVTFTMFPI